MEETKCCLVCHEYHWISGRAGYDMRTDYVACDVCRELMHKRCWEQIKDDIEPTSDANRVCCLDCELKRKGLEESKEQKKRKREQELQRERERLQAKNEQ